MKRGKLKLPNVEKPTSLHSAIKAIDTAEMYNQERSSLYRKALRWIKDNPDRARSLGVLIGKQVKILHRHVAGFLSEVTALPYEVIPSVPDNELPGQLEVLLNSGESVHLLTDFCSRFGQLLRVVTYNRVRFDYLNRADFLRGQGVDEEAIPVSLRAEMGVALTTIQNQAYYLVYMDRFWEYVSKAEGITE